MAQARSNFQNTIFGMKRLIGRSFSEPEVQEEIKGLPFKVVATPSGGLAYEVTYDGETKLCTPEQVGGACRTVRGGEEGETSTAESSKGMWRSLTSIRPVCAVRSWP